VLFDSSLELPLDVEFTVVGVDAESGRGVLVADAGRRDRDRPGVSR